MAATKTANGTRSRSTNSNGNGNTADAAADRIRDLNERIIESSKKAGSTYLDIYEKTLNSIADYQEKVGEQSQVDWISTIANAQANFTRDLAGAYSSAARSLLK
jgi:hypothetical protein